MKNILKFLSLAAITVVGFAACIDKVDDLPYYTTGNDVVLSSSVSTIAVAPADSAKSVVTFSWTTPSFATDTANYKYVLDVDTSSAFPAPSKFSVMSARQISLTGADFNTMLVKWNVPYGTAKALYVRVRPSYGNNNDMKTSNILTITVSNSALPFLFTATAYGPFAPSALNQNQTASTLNWTKPSYGTTSMKYEIMYDSATKNFSNPKYVTVGVDVYNYAMTFKQFNIMAQFCGIAYNVPGAIDVKVKATSTTSAGVTALSDVRRFTGTPQLLIAYLWVAGDYQKFPPYAANLPAGNNWGWDPASAPRLASTDGLNFDGYIWVPAGGSGEFKFTSQNDWNGTNYGSGGGNTISTSGGNINWPSQGQYFRVQVNMSTLTWSATPITSWGAIGDATPFGWGGQTNLTFNTTTLKWVGSVNFNAVGAFKFRANDDPSWSINLGGNPNQLTYGGDNIPTPGAGLKTVTLDLTNPPYYKVTVL